MKIRYLPLQPHCFAFGGFEIQMLSALEAVQSMGVAAEKLDVWSKEKDFDILHIWGLDQAQYNTVYWAKQSGKKVVVTALLPYMENFYQKARNLFFSQVGNEKYMRRIVRMIDALVVVNEMQKEISVNYFSASPQKTFIVPNLVDKGYFEFVPGKFSEKYKVENYVLCVGNICARKNQLNLVRACVKGNVNLVLIGHVLAGEEAIASEIESVMRQHRNILWVKGLEPQSEDLIHAFFDCALFALPSYVEQQPISALEAGAAGKPLLMAKRAYAKQSYYQNCKLVDPDSVDEIAKGIDEIFQNPRQFIVPTNVIEACKRPQIGLKYKEVYDYVGGR